MSLSIFSQNGVELSHVDKLSSATTEASIEAGLALLDAETGWENVKTIHEKKTNHSVHITKLHPRKKSDRERDRGEKLTWFRRTSEHDPAIDLSYEEFRQGLTVVSSAFCLLCSSSYRWSDAWQAYYVTQNATNGSSHTHFAKGESGQSIADDTRR